mmetsp:Transcript_15146/g.28816  ORF Transcript_15146/g.28816 Transcript_15146/m.28816 type:complete len:151 (-) Transcript_15146:165-617(-)
MMANDPLERARRGVHSVSREDPDIENHVETKDERLNPTRVKFEEKRLRSEAKTMPTKTHESKAIQGSFGSDASVIDNKPVARDDARIPEVKDYGLTLTSLDSTLNAKMEEARKALVSVSSPSSIVLHATAITELAKAIESLRAIRRERII